MKKLNEHKHGGSNAKHMTPNERAEFAVIMMLPKPQRMEALRRFPALKNKR